MLLILGVISSLHFFDHKACKRFCEREGYDFCVPIAADSKHYYCADKIEKNATREMIWTARWTVEPKVEVADPDL